MASRKEYSHSGNSRKFLKAHEIKRQEMTVGSYLYNCVRWFYGRSNRGRFQAKKFEKKYKEH